MRTFLSVVVVVLCLFAVPAVSGAAPIGTNACSAVPSGIFECDIFADFESAGASLLGETDGNPGSYLPGYTFLLNEGADLSTFDITDVAHILVIHNQLYELFSNTVASTTFANIFAAASGGADIDGGSPDLGQLAGCPPIPTGVPSFGGVGYCTTADTITLLVNWGVGGPDPIGGLDVLRIHTALPVVEPPPTEDVPEPSSLALLVLGGASMFVRRRKAAKAA